MARIPAHAILVTIGGASIPITFLAEARKTTSETCGIGEEDILFLESKRRKNGTRNTRAPNSGSHRVRHWMDAREAVVFAAAGPVRLRHCKKDMNDNAYTGQRGCPECGSGDSHYMSCSKNPLHKEWEDDRRRRNKKDTGEDGGMPHHSAEADTEGS